jgi:hypothetical protein
MSRFPQGCKIGFLKVLNPAAISTEILQDRQILQSSNYPGDLEGPWSFGKSAGFSANLAGFQRNGAVLAY